MEGRFWKGWVMTSDDGARIAFRALLNALADAYGAEDRAGAQELVALLREGAESAVPEPAQPYRYDAAIRAATEGADHPAAVAARGAHGLLRWSATGILDELIPETVSDMFAVAPLVGPGTVIYSDRVRAGLFMQLAGSFYPAHAHSAEETYIMLAGEAEWQLDLGDWHRHGPGAMIHHPSEAPHATRTGTVPILAAWRWSGDVRSETYRMVG